MEEFRNKQNVQRAIDFLNFYMRKAYNPYLDRNNETFPENTQVGRFIKNIDKENNPVIVTKLWEVISGAFGLIHGAIMRGANDLSDQININLIPSLHMEDKNIVKNDGIQNFLFKELFDISIESRAVRSTPEAILRIYSYLKTVDPVPDKKWLFRGQKEFDWYVTPKIYRTMKDSRIPIPEGISGVTKYELENLLHFQKNIEKFNLDKIDLAKIKDMNKNDPAWWLFMQHYSSAGTRLLDVTTSPLIALWISCVNWEDGSIHDKKDGIVHIYYTNFRNEKMSDKTTESIFNNSLHQQSSFQPIRYISDSTLFENERSKVQYSEYLWQTELDKPFDSNAFFLIDKDKKEEIVFELNKIGINKDYIQRTNKQIDNN